MKWAALTFLISALVVLFFGNSGQFYALGVLTVGFLATGFCWLFERGK